MLFEQFQIKIWLFLRFIFHNSDKIAWKYLGETFYRCQFNPYSYDLHIEKMEVTRFEFVSLLNWRISAKKIKNCRKRCSTFHLVSDALLGSRMKPKYNGRLIIDSYISTSNVDYLYTNNLETLLNYIKDQYIRKRDENLIPWFMTPQEFYKNFYRKAVKTILDFE